ncbi:hypothetical protein [Chitinophaga silvisoli]|uniref:Uncharacterized protein n=1 Tax=Chitinophaga silvisoli TaxID=2291814 RepID=A0A3E1NUK6_9BACT|nr:hypothetical protein [Chitinophaga silvisoli]RFM31586.1 hypothetical protein DXN04_28130 [Chitinophaga silvisoli]
MTISDIYNKLHSRAYYEKTEHNKFRFLNNSLCIDRRATIPIVIHMLDGIFYMQSLKKIANESLFRLEMNDEEIKVISTINDSPIFTLE